MAFETVIGLEVHAQLSTRSKIFCACSTAFGAPPNGNTCPVCTGMPGVLPVLNRKAVEFTIRTALATSCTVQRRSVFARKNYFYPDLPKAYQISQYELPIALGGHVDIEVDGGTKRIGITRIHMEEDAGKLVHEGEFAGAQASLADLNRCSVPLMEIVSEPDMRTPEEGGAYLRRLHDILVYLGVCDGNMEEGSFRCDANVSVRPVGQAAFGTKAELKNMNSFRNVEKALEYEIRRQVELIEDGGKVVQETRLWDANAGVTVSMRRKEEAHDYRYFPEPDLGALVVDEAWIAEAVSGTPELPRARRKRFVENDGLPDSDAETLVSSRELADYFERAVKAGSPPKIAANWITGELLRWMKERKHSAEEALSFAVSPERLAELLAVLESGEVSAASAKEVLEAMLDSPVSARQLVQQRGLGKLRDAGALDGIVSEIVTANPSQVALYRSGKTQTFGWFVGQVMKKTGGRADPGQVRAALEAKLGAPPS